MNCYFTTANTKRMSILQFYVDYCKGIYFVMPIVWYASCFLFGFVPLLLEGQNFICDAVYPFAIDESPMYELVYAHQLYSIFQLCSCMCTNNFFTFFLWYVISRIDELSTKFCDIKTAADFRKAVQEHQYILR